MRPSPSRHADRDLVAVHSSDLHIDDVTNRPGASDGLDMLSAVLTVGRRHQADVILLAGDTFESHRLPPALIERTAAILANSELAIAILPGNHDPVIPNAVYHQRSLREIDNLHVLGVTCPDALLFSHLDLEIWGRPHLGYGDMLPFERARPRPLRIRSRSYPPSPAIVAHQRCASCQHRG
jgi:DNA repair exonuclease SbcCD nuclease subunit